MTKDKDFIDVEIVNDDSVNDNDAGLSRQRARNDQKQDRGGLFQKVAGTAKSAVGGLTKLFGVDEETKRKRAMKKQLNTEIDNVFKGGGIMGGLMGGIVKSIGGVLMESMAQNANDVEDVQRAVSQLLRQHDKSRNVVGESIQCFMPMQSGSSSTNINGVYEKRISLMFPVQGSRGSGQVQVEASSRGKQGLQIDTLILRTMDGRTIDVPTSRGGGGTIIDAEIL